MPLLSDGSLDNFCGTTEGQLIGEFFKFEFLDFQIIACNHDYIEAKLNAVVSHPNFDFRGKIRAYFLEKNSGRFMNLTIIRW